jgi:hypothetical protein
MRFIDLSVLYGVRKPTALLFVRKLKRFRTATVEHFLRVYFEKINKMNFQSSLIYKILYYLVRENPSFHEL